MSALVRSIAILLVFLAPAPVLAESGCGAPADLGDGWRVAAPADQGLDPALLCAIGPRFEAWKEANAHAVIVVRHGVLVYERYFAGEDERWGTQIGRVTFDAATKHDVRSITKSVTALTGSGMSVEPEPVAPPQLATTNARRSTAGRPGARPRSLTERA